ncbi:Eco57I restriction-modification methylase domain-containing protein [Brevibacillus sp. FSL L8-0520]|uniref:Eco57I restriction-modification methylase domain-containing protein n=1 Tax=Brevibacillus sp. FSL L8-0520 TaxID=2954689 RepID=UPI0030D1C9EE
MQQFLEQIDSVRLKVSSKTDPKRKSELGQFMTPSTIARFMASLFTNVNIQNARLLDPGAGVGSLSCAFLERWATRGFTFESVEVVASELDPKLHDHLSASLGVYKDKLPLDVKVLKGDFIEQAINMIQSEGEMRFTHAILNPPYKKMNSNSRHRLLLRQVGIETVNLYSAFVALTLALMEQGGQLVAIIPRSFCNGPYFRPFRQYIFERSAIKHIHLFGARNKAFKDESVLQENVIILLECGAQQGEVTISTSTDDSFTDYQTYLHPFNRVVLPNDPEFFIHIPTSLERNPIDISSNINYSLQDLGIDLSTGPVVDFRVKEHLRDMPEPGAVPLLYPMHFVGQLTDWPKPGMKKPNAIMLNPDTEKWLYKNGFYTVVRRFSSKEERRRVVAGVVNPAYFDYPLLGFENHLNVFHCKKQGLPEELAYGLFVYLNSTVVDEYFRIFNGHTQVNATDLRNLKYPSRETLIELGKWVRAYETITQQDIDQKLEEIL